MGSRIGSNTILLSLPLLASLTCCSAKPETAAVAQKQIRQKEELAGPTADNEETAHIILQFRGCKAHQ